ncbi:hypothetical protein CDD81_7827 [Ophiocordyceps australis]|uniref:Uncharacterized protein n=1 Tax=Ophiocordyceps australis TaxID=1399860 RepID=A0A2C5YGX2_9HYPO|nr:hypothetical protein CDD81_7827 [Ophiocordyceps australis]
MSMLFRDAAAQLGFQVQQHASRRASINLDSNAAHMSYPLQCHDLDGQKSPLLLMTPLELNVLDKERRLGPVLASPSLPLSTSSSPWPTQTLPLETYLRDENEHERRLLRLSEPTVTTVPSDAVSDFSPNMTQTQSTLDDQQLHLDSLLDDAEFRDLSPCSLLSLPRAASPRILPDDASICSRFSAVSENLSLDSAVSDLVVAAAPLAQRLAFLQRELQATGMGGLSNGLPSALRYHRAGQGGHGVRVRKPRRLRRRVKSAARTLSQDEEDEHQVY